MKKLSFVLALIWASYLSVYGQAVTTEPLLPNGDKEITLIFDLKLAKDARAKGLLGKTSDVYLWSGAGTTATGDAFEYQPTGQTDFSKPFEKGKMTALGNDVWSIKMIPRNYFAVPTGKSLKRLGVLLKSGSGSAQTEDFIVTLYDAVLSVAFLTPVQESTVLQQGQDLPISIRISEKAILTAETRVGDTLVPSDFLKLPKDSTDTFTTTIPFTSLEQLVMTNGKSSMITMKVQAKNKSALATAQITVMVPPKNIVENVPAAWKDGINYLSDTQVGLVLFAPSKDFVYVIGDFNDWKPTGASLMKRSVDGTRYWIEIDGLEKAKEYAFQYLVNGVLAVADPFSEKILDPNNDKYIPASTYPNLKTLPQTVKTIASVLQTGQENHVWKINDFKRPAKEDLVIYELHVRDFVGDKSYKSVMDTLSYLKNLGINAIELMPVQEFTGNDSWGYNPIFYFAPDKAYGSKNDLKVFIDKCHEMGIAVLMDMVFNQADYEFPYVKMYWDGSKPSVDSPFFNQQANHPFSVFFDFNHESQATRNYVNRANEFWLKEYKIDGYRFDLAKGFTQKSSSNDSQFRLYDQSRVDIWKQYYDNIRKKDPSAYVILELFSEDFEERTFIDYGMMVWGNHNYDFRNMAKGENADLSRLSYKARGMSSAGVVSYMESHDEERVVFDALQNGKSVSGYSTKELSTVLERVKANTAIFMAVPGPKMIWQFGEIGYDISIDQNGRTGQKPLKWDYLQDTRRRNLYKAFAAIAKLKTSQSVFKTSDFDTDLTGLQKKVLLRSAENTVLVIGNFDISSKAITKVFPKVGKWYDYFTGDSFEVTDTSLPLFLQAGEFHIFSIIPLPKPEVGLVPWKAPASLIITATENEPPTEVKLYPNPAQNILTIEIPTLGKSAVNFTLYDFYGRALINTLIKDKKTDFDIQSLKDGFYLVYLQEQDRKTILKFTKVNK